MKKFFTHRVVIQIVETKPIAIQSIQQPQHNSQIRHRQKSITNKRDWSLLDDPENIMSPANPMSPVHPWSPLHPRQTTTTVHRSYQWSNIKDDDDD